MSGHHANPTFKQFELEGWEQCVTAYDHSFSPLTMEAGRALLERLAISAGMEVLDIACGPGHLVAELLERGAKVIGADFSPAMVAAAAARYPHGRFAVEDAEKLSYAAGSFDAATMNFGLLHLGSPEQAVREAARVLRPGGGFGFTVWAPPTEALAFGVIMKAVEQFGDPKVPLPEGPPFFKYSAPDAATALLTEAGFRQIGVEKLPLRWTLSSPDELFEVFFRGTARTGGLLRRQSEAQLGRIRDAVVAEAAERFATGNERQLEIPMPAMVYWART